MKKFKNHQRPRREYRFDIVGHKKALKIWWDGTFKLRKLKSFLLFRRFLLAMLSFWPGSAGLILDLLTKTTHDPSFRKS
jgi:hypothetical protein